MIDYKSFPGLAGVFLEDSYVLGISESSEQVVFRLDAALTAVQDLAVRRDLRDAVAKSIANQFLYAPTRLSCDGLPT
jgi:hypothetical protein